MIRAVFDCTDEMVNDIEDILHHIFMMRDPALGSARWKNLHKRDAVRWALEFAGKEARRLSPRPPAPRAQQE